jgi:hypothetical protein
MPLIAVSCLLSIGVLFSFGSSRRPWLQRKRQQPNTEPWLSEAAHQSSCFVEVRNFRAGGCQGQLTSTGRWRH